MTDYKKAVFGICRSRAQAEVCVSKLQQAGFNTDDMSVLMSDQDSSRDLAVEKATKAPEGVTAGASAGGVIGGALGLLAGIGALAVPGLGPFIAAGPIMGALAGLGVGSAAGGLIGVLAGMGVPEYEAKRYEGHVKEGGILVSVHCESAEMADRAKDILKNAGAESISTTSESAVDDEMKAAG